MSDNVAGTLGRRQGGLIADLLEPDRTGRVRAQSQIQKTFGPWWNQSWPEGMKGLHQLIQHHPQKTVRYAIWNDRLWVQCWAGSRHPPAASVFSTATLDALAKLDADTLKAKVLTPEYRPVIVNLILERRDQVLKAAQGQKRVP